jgi:hypothetical protein
MILSVAKANKKSQQSRIYIEPIPPLATTCRWLRMQFWLHSTNDYLFEMVIGKMIERSNQRHANLFFRLYPAQPSTLGRLFSIPSKAYTNTHLLEMIQIIQQHIPITTLHFSAPDNLDWFQAKTIDLINTIIASCSKTTSVYITNAPTWHFTTTIPSRKELYFFTCTNQPKVAFDKDQFLCCLPQLHRIKLYGVGHRLETLVVDVKEGKKALVTKEASRAHDQVD